MSDETRTAAPRTKRRLVVDAEIQAMAELDRILCDLPDTSLPRVLGWLVAKHSNCTTILRGEPYAPAKPE